MTSAGCKFQKHITKGEGDEEEGITDQVAIIKCYICKELGHLSAECDKDPNYRT